MHNKERDVLEMRKIDECDMRFSTLNNRQKTIAIPRHTVDGGHKRRNRKGIIYAECFYAIHEKTYERPICWRCLY